MPTDLLRGLLTAAAAGRPSTRADLDSLPLDPDRARETRAEIQHALDRVRTLRRIGLYRQAYQLAQITATNLARHVDTVSTAVPTEDGTDRARQSRS